MSATNPEHTSTILMTLTLPAAKASALANWEEGFIDRTIWNELDPGYFVMDAFDFMSFVLFEEESPRGIPVRALYVCFEDADSVHEVVKVHRYDVTSTEGVSVDLVFMAAPAGNPREVDA